LPHVPQLLGSVCNAWQMALLPLPHSESGLGHDVPQLVPLHVADPLLGALQVCVVLAAQAPEPLQSAADDITPLEQLRPRQAVKIDGYVHAIALPSAHLPPHAVPSVVHAARVPCGCPDRTAVHVPCTPATSQAWHDPLHAVLQQ
jgi:hypothetical protein